MNVSERWKSEALISNEGGWTPGDKSWKTEETSLKESYTSLKKLQYAQKRTNPKFIKVEIEKFLIVTQIYKTRKQKTIRKQKI